MRLLRRPLAAGAALLLVYVGLSFLMDPHGYLGTDTGAKVATLDRMVDRGTARPDLGYWAAERDPDGSLHPVHDAVPNDEGEWVHVTTLPMLEAARPLYAAGGYRLALLLPMLGSVGAAFAARAIARRLGPGDGWIAYWVVGLGSPAAVYALDLWEHSIGLACMLWSVALVLDVTDGRIVGPALGAGALLGVSATMRTETFVYAFAAVAAACGALWWEERSLRRPLLAGTLAVMGFAGPWLLNVALEAQLGGHSRAERATGDVGTFGSKLGQRIEEGSQTLVGLNSGEMAQSVFLGTVIVLVVLYAFRAERRGDRRFAAVCLLAVACAYLVDAAGGLGFISGLFLAFPLAIAAIPRLVATRRHTVVAVIAVASLPLVYLSQSLGGAAPQWGGRYTLTSAILLGVVGLVGLLERRPTVGRGLVVLSLVVTALGVAWLGVRSRGAHEFFDDVVDQAEPVVISRQAFLFREAGPRLLDHQWLSTRDEQAFTEAVDLARSLGEERFSVLEWGAAAPPETSLPDDVREVGRSALTFVDVPVGLVTYEFTG
jgi:hypothetical protein